MPAVPVHSSGELAGFRADENARILTRNLARIGFFVPVLMLVISLAVNRAFAGNDVVQGIFGLLVLALMVVGMLVALTALVRYVAGWGRKGLGYIITGLLFNGLFLSIAAVAFVNGVQRGYEAAQIKPMSVEEISRIPLKKDGWTVFHDGARGFRVEVPPNFEVLTTEKVVDKGVRNLVVYIDPEKQQQELIYGLGIQAIEVQLAQGRQHREMIKAEFAHNPQFSDLKFHRVPWGSHQLYFVTGIMHQDVPMSVCMVQIPIVGETIQIVLYGEPGEQGKLLDEMRELLPTVVARSSWGGGNY